MVDVMSPLAALTSLLFGAARFSSDRSLISLQSLLGMESQLSVAFLGDDPFENGEDSRVRRPVVREQAVVTRPSLFEACPSILILVYWPWHGVYELRIHTATEYRVFYVAKFEEAVYALHCFEKKSRRTPAHDLEIGRERYRTLLRERARAK